MEKLTEFRKEIESIDLSIIQKLAERSQLVAEIAHLKMASNQPIYDAQREGDLLSHHLNLATEYELQPKFVLELFKIIFDYSKKLQADIFQSRPDGEQNFL